MAFMNTLVPTDARVSARARLAQEPACVALPLLNCIISTQFKRGPAPEAGFDIVLGRNPPVITPVSGLDNGAAKKIPFPFVVSSTDIQQFQVEAVDSLSLGTSSCDCHVKWRLALDWSYEGKTGTTVIDDNGQPFQTFFPRWRLPGLCGWTKTAPGSGSDGAPL
jgi:hypothetical protein